MLIKTIETKRLILRKPQPSDLLAFNYYAAKPNIGPNAGWSPHHSLDESKLILDNFISKDTEWAVTIKPFDVMVGSVGVHEEDHYNNQRAISIGYVLDDTYWNNGYMTEAVIGVLDYLFNSCGYLTVWVSHADFNQASAKVISKCGFRFCFITQKTYIENYQIKDVYYYKMTRKDFNKKYGNKISD